ncbi:hypothetical protein CG51_05735 [Haematobacter missouriensis]|uniref:DUF1150 domain-containing protein n=2 Tax=Haematobacter TaxID=366614 RepID=A0A212AT19_9RHOB|nr:MULTISPECIES: DUF1150 family protein [Haematobacter]KFI31628.1 hypothetical protein CG51_05735 [Haematobacter missouriensis]OWJ75696.1 hypothetical protein CDV53_09815 [Haematobacter missouriensis]OWJ80020.1 hypothetical protein CDV49_04390 [Haematobacter genomosp. 1]OWJ84604.1 hypothetical protein CDV52_07960 [Haematobacter missouriensis]
MDAEFELSQAGAERIVYVRPVEVSELPEIVQEQALGAKQLYALYDEDGERLALVRDRRIAFALARENNLAPVSVH